MTRTDQHDVWDAGNIYESYVGRWSLPVAHEFLDWLALPAGLRWLDIGCGTGTLSRVIVERCAPREVVGVDLSDGFIAYAREKNVSENVTFQTGSAESLPVDGGTYDAAVSGLMLNFVPNMELALAEMRRALQSGGTVAAYVWDYAGEMQLMRYFWNAAVDLDPSARELDEGERFPITQSAPLAALFQDSGFRHVETRAIDVPTVFENFDDYWTPFLGGQGPAPAYCMSLPKERREALRSRIHADLPVDVDGSIRLIARAWAVRGTVAKGT